MRRRRFISAMIAVTLLALTAASASYANPQVNYYGYNYLSVSTPTDCSASFGYGCAQGNFNNWDWSGMDKVNGDCTSIGFRDTAGAFYTVANIFCSEWNNSSFHISRSGGGVPPYNRGYCAYVPGPGPTHNSSYARCWTRICPCGADPPESVFSPPAWALNLGQSRLSQMSNRGTEASLSVKERMELSAFSIAPEVRLLGTRSTTSFYTGWRPSGDPCFLTSRSTPTEQAGFGIAACLGPGVQQVPSAARPLLDFSSIVVKADSAGVTLNWLTGFASDQVTSVGYVDAEGTTHQVPVEHNIYASEGIGATALAIVAYDRTGSVIYRIPLNTRGLR